MKIIITMAGLGNRFTKIGIDYPKYKIVAREKTLFEWSMLSLKSFFDEEFIFISRSEIFDYEFIEKVCNQIGLINYKVVILDKMTDGQATTAFMANSYIDDNESCIIYNIDTYVKPFSINKEDIKDDYDGFIPVIVAEGDRWSFVRVDENFNVVEVAEKKPISNLASIGFYYFKSWEKYKDIYNKMHENIRMQVKETYIAPMYKSIIDEKGFIGIKVINSSDVFILGTPEEIGVFDKDYLKNNKVENNE